GTRGCRGQARQLQTIFEAGRVSCRRRKTSRAFADGRQSVGQNACRRDGNRNPRNRPLSPMVARKAFRQTNRFLGRWYDWRDRARHGAALAHWSSGARKAPARFQRTRLPNSYPRGGLPTCLTASRFATVAAAFPPSASKAIYGAVKAFKAKLSISFGSTKN